jgi:molybdopterin synthase catalytic subunit/molybdopterin converting factor small subunit
MKLTVVLFATLKDRAGAGQVVVELPEGASTAALVAALGAQHPALGPALASAVVAVNREFAFEDVTLRPDDEVALFPPVSGGVDIPAGGADWPEVLRVTDETLDFNALVRAISGPATGGVCVFTGLVRGETAPARASGLQVPEGGDRLRVTARLHYEAYAPMAEEKLRQVVAEIRARWPDVQGIAIVQRVGTLEAGEPTVIIAVAAGHRDQGIFEAARYGIDRLKEIVPVWKQEIGPDGQAWVTGHYHPTPDDRTPS